MIMKRMEADMEQTERFKEMQRRMEPIRRIFGPESHKAVAIYEECVDYPMEDVLELNAIGQSIMSSDPEDPGLKDKVAHFAEVRDAILAKRPAPEDRKKKIPLWPEGKIPCLTEYTDNSSFRYHHDPDFVPYMYEMLVSEDVTPKGAIVVCPGGDHAEAVLHEGYQVCLDMNELGYQCFFLLNRPNMMPWSGLEAGTDAARAIRYVRANAAKYRIPADRVAFAGFSNGGLTGEQCVQYNSGDQTVAEHFPGYEPDELDKYYGAPDALLCVYGPRWAGGSFDYSRVKYPPVFFAVGREDTAMDNLHFVYPELLAHGVTLEVHTFAGTPHGQAGAKLYHGGISQYPNFDMWEPLADMFLDDVYAKR